MLRDGTVGWVRALKAEPRGYFEQAAVAGVRSWRFRPARAGGQTIECRMVTRVRFALVDTVDVRAGSLNERQPVPVYPPKLLQQRIEGYVEVEFDVTAEGATAKARVIAAMPRGAFESASLAAIRRWRFDPGSARRETRRFEYRLPDSTLTTVPAMLLASAPFPMAACEQNQTGESSRSRCAPTRRAPCCRRASSPRRRPGCSTRRRSPLPAPRGSRRLTGTACRSRRSRS